MVFWDVFDGTPGAGRFAPGWGMTTSRKKALTLLKEVRRKGFRKAYLARHPWNGFRIMHTSLASWQHSGCDCTGVDTRQTQERPGAQPIEVADLPRIMALVAQQCNMIMDLTGDIEATAEFATPSPLKVVSG